MNVFYCSDCVVVLESAVDKDIYCLCRKEMTVIGFIEDTKTVLQKSKYSKRG